MKLKKPEPEPELAVEVERIAVASSEQMKLEEGRNFVVLGLGDKQEELVGTHIEPMFLEAAVLGPREKPSRCTFDRGVPYVGQKMLVLR